MKIVQNKAEYEEILKTNKSVFVDFYADWCGPCKMVGPLVEKLSEKETDVAFVKVNVDVCPDIAGMYGIMSIPTLLTFKDGVQVGGAVGFRPEEELQQLVNAIK